MVESNQWITVPWFERKQQDDRLDRCHRTIVDLGTVVLRPRMRVSNDTEEPPKPAPKPSVSEAELDQEFLRQITQPFDDMLNSARYPELSEEQHRTLANRVRVKLDEELRTLFKHFKKRRSKFNNGGMFPKPANRVRTEALFRVEVNRELNFEGILAKVAKGMGVTLQPSGDLPVTMEKGKSRLGRAARPVKRVQPPSRPRHPHSKRNSHRQVHQQKQVANNSMQNQGERAEIDRKTPPISETPPIDGNQEVEQTEDRKDAETKQQETNLADAASEATSEPPKEASTTATKADNSSASGSGAGDGSMQNAEDWEQLAFMSDEPDNQVVQQETPTLNLPRLKTNLRDWLREHEAQKKAARGPYQGDDIHAFRIRARAPSQELAGAAFRSFRRDSKNADRSNSNGGHRAARPSRPRYLPNRNPNVNIVELKEGSSILADYPVPRHALEAIKLYHLKERQMGGGGSGGGGGARADEPRVVTLRSSRNAGLQLSCFAARVTPSAIAAILDPRLAPHPALAVDDLALLVGGVACRADGTAGEGGALGLPAAQLGLDLVPREPFVRETRDAAAHTLAAFGAREDMPGLLRKLEELFPAEEMRRHTRKLLYGHQLPAECTLSLDLMQNLELSLESTPAENQQDTKPNAGRRRDLQAIEREAKEYSRQLDSAVRAQGDNVSWLLALMGRRAPAHAAAMQRWSELVANEVETFDEQHPVPLDGATSQAFETAWKQLEVPGLQKLDMVLKYTSRRHHAQAATAAPVLAAASDHVAQREEALERLMAEFDAAKEGGHVIPADRVVKMLQQFVVLTGMSKFYCNLMFEEFEEVVTFRGTSYFEKIDQDNKQLQELF